MIFTIFLYRIAGDDNFQQPQAQAVSKVAVSGVEVRLFACKQQTQAS
jgi:hypothetical protein